MVDEQVERVGSAIERIRAAAGGENLPRGAAGKIRWTAGGLPADGP
jgi:hypothetical protein